MSEDKKKTDKVELVEKMTVRSLLKQYTSKWRDFCISAICAIIIFGVWKIESSYYFAVLIAIELGLVGSYFNPKSNSAFYLKVVTLVYGNILGYSISRLLQGCGIDNVSNLERALLVIAAMPMLVLILSSIYSYNKNRPEKLQEPKLLQCREDDLERLYQYLDKVDIVGLNGAWGTGKSFLINYFVKQQEIRETYEVITIDLLTCNLDEIDYILWDELEKLLSRKGIFSEYSRNMKQMTVGEGIGNNLKNLLWNGSDSRANAFASLKKELDKLGEKHVLLIFEDIDRIKDNDVIKKIFAISEKLAGQRVKIVYQYDESNLQQQGFTKEYLEKYIPYVVNVTPLRFSYTVDVLWDEVGMKDIAIEKADINKLEYPLYEGSILQKATNGGFGPQIMMKNVPLRKTKQFLEELKLLVQEKEQSIKEEHEINVCDVIIRFLFLKHFDYATYEKLCVGETLLNSLTFEYQQEQYTLTQLIYKYEQGEITSETVREILAEPEHRANYAALLLFGYEPRVIENKRRMDNDVKIANKNEKIDRIIWNLLGRGTSEYADIQAVVKKLETEVLRYQGEEQIRAWRKYTDDLYHHENMKMGNKSIFLFGRDSFESLFQACYIMGISSESWIRMIDMYCNVRTVTTIDVELIACLKYCDYQKKDVLFHMVESFNHFILVGNLNHDENYFSFLKNVFRGMSTFGLADPEIWWMADSLGSEKSEYNQQLAIDLLHDCKKYLETTAATYHEINAVQHDIAVCQTFLDKNIALIEMAESLPERKHGVTTNVSSRYPHQEKRDALEQMRNEKTRKEFLAAVEAAYQNGEIYLRALNSIMPKEMPLKENDFGEMKQE